MTSQHFGERSAQHWLDVARYADTAGLSNDYERSNMWRYRDYVIRSFNGDKPYNQFVVEQIAGDELWEKQKKQEKVWCLCLEPLVRRAYLIEVESRNGLHDICVFCLIFI